MEFRTGRAGISVNVWTDEAREKAADARKMNSKARENYKGLSDEEKSQFHKDYEAAQEASRHAKDVPSADSHENAARAHEKAAKSSPTVKQRAEHKTAAEDHRIEARAHKAGQRPAADIKAKQRVAEIKQEAVEHRQRAADSTDKASKAEGVAKAHEKGQARLASRSKDQKTKARVTARRDAQRIEKARGKPKKK